MSLTSTYNGSRFALIRADPGAGPQDLLERPTNERADPDRESIALDIEPETGDQKERHGRYDEECFFHVGKTVRDAMPSSHFDEGAEPHLPPATAHQPG